MPSSVEVTTTQARRTCHLSVTFCVDVEDECGDAAGLGGGEQCGELVLVGHAARPDDQPPASDGGDGAGVGAQPRLRVEPMEFGERVSDSQPAACLPLLPVGARIVE